jgi:two-component system, chemotaxis family, protein-glutamate methylesterase/glutaminase
MNGPPPPAWLITVAASAGGVTALQTLVRDLPKDLRASVIVVLHRPPDFASMLESILRRAARMRVAAAIDGEHLEPGVIYIARPDLHLILESDYRFTYVDHRRIRFVRSSANPLLETAARLFRDRAIGVVLTGMGHDATDGVQAVKAQGGIVIAQDPLTAAHGGMPASAIRTGAVDLVLPLAEIGPTLTSIVGVEAETAVL